MDREKIGHFTKDELLTRLDWLASYAYTHNDLLTACIARDALALLKEQEECIKNTKEQMQKIINGEYLTEKERKAIDPKLWAKGFMVYSPKILW